MNKGKPVFSATERAILELLSDGKPHTKAEIKTLLGPYTDHRQVRSYISRLRPRLAEHREEILCMFGPGTKYYYQHVVTLTPSPPGRAMAVDRVGGYDSLGLGRQVCLFSGDNTDAVHSNGQVLDHSSNGVVV